MPVRQVTSEEQAERNGHRVDGEHDRDRQRREPIALRIQRPQRRRHGRERHDGHEREHDHPEPKGGIPRPRGRVRDSVLRCRHVDLFSSRCHGEALRHLGSPGRSATTDRWPTLNPGNERVMNGSRDAVRFSTPAHPALIGAVDDRRMPLRWETGFPETDAAAAFARARRRQSLATLASRLKMNPGSALAMLSFHEVVATVGRVAEHDLGVQEIALESIVGTVSRRRDEFDRLFRPRSRRLQARWQRIATARRRGHPMPPIDVYRIGDLHFVQDGHHRVSVARANGDTTIDANVRQVQTRVAVTDELALHELWLTGHERVGHRPRLLIALSCKRASVRAIPNTQRTTGLVHAPPNSHR